MIEGAFLGVGYSLFCFLRFLTRREHDELPTALLVCMFVILAFAALVCAFGIIGQVLAQRAKGDILVYDPRAGVLKLPRERLILYRSQVVEFRILQERVPPEPGTISLIPKSLTRGSAGAAELQIVYRNPNQKSATLLRGDGSHMFRDVIAALKKSGIARVVLVEPQPGTSEWKVSAA